MVSLYLRAPSGGEVGDGDDARRRRERLDGVAAVLERVSGAEAHMWLITTLASLEVPSRVQVDCFFDLLQNSMRESVKRGGESGHGKRLPFNNLVRKFIHICEGCVLF
jgi:hypothetical protein